jgi:hypothetical protein
MKVTLTLNKANKVLEKLKAQIKADVGSANSSNRIARLRQTCDYFGNEVPKLMGVVRVTVNLDQPANVIRERTALAIKATLEQHQQHFNFLRDFYALKEAVFQTNVTSGVSQLLSSIEEGNIRLKITSSLRSQLEMENVQSLDALSNQHLLNEARGLILSSEKPLQQYDVQVYDLEKVRSEELELRRRLNALEEERTTKNATVRVTVELSQTTLDLMGIAS